MADEKKGEMIEKKDAGRQLAIREKEMSLDDTLTLGMTLYKSGLFPSATSQAGAVAVILAGRELGIGPVTSLNKIHIVKGKVCVSAEIMAACIKNSKDCDYLIRKHTKSECDIEFFRNGKSSGHSTFTIDDAKQAKVYKDDSGWMKYPRNMLYARAMSNGARWYCANHISGAYIPEEVGMVLDGNGMVIENEVVVNSIPEAETNKTARKQAEVPKDDETIRDDRESKVEEFKKKYGLTLMKKVRTDLDLGKVKIADLQESDYQKFIEAIGEEREKKISELKGVYGLKACKEVKAKLNLGKIADLTPGEFKDYVQAVEKAKKLKK